MNPPITVAVCHVGESLSCAAVANEEDGTLKVLGDASIKLDSSSSTFDAVNRLLVTVEHKTEVMIREVIFQGCGESSRSIEKAMIVLPLHVIPANYSSANATELALWWAGSNSAS